MRPVEIDPRELEGRSVRAVVQIVDADDVIEALQLVFDDGTCAVFTIWTDWTLLVEDRADQDIPDYLWPTGERTRRPLSSGVPVSGGAIHDVTPVSNEVGELAGVTLVLNGQVIVARSVGGELDLLVQ